ncbi:MAG: hypothetical protein B7Z06_11205 [Flavobacteriales bacterium 32-35-8]|nr:MAG: hypothetical protein B7Z06_11205 [Flavobacteriales bacterium 32-35-8]
MNAATTASSRGGIWEWIKELFNPNKGKGNNNKGGNHQGGNNQQGGNHQGGNNQQGNNQQGGDSVPLDGGLGILLLGAAAFGVKKLREGKHEEA